MGRTGFGVMIHRAFGGISQADADAFKAAIGKEIKAIDISDARLRIVPVDGDPIEFYDDGQSCCERRYMRTDDDLQLFVGAKFMEAEVRASGESTKGECDEEHEIQFLLVTTSKGVFTVANHNEHNGYYGGFAVTVRKGEP